MRVGSQVRHFGIVTQVYPPDPAAVGQHLADVAHELSRLGHRVTVITSDRGYDDVTERYPRFEREDNIFVMRLPFCSFGKGSIAARLLGGCSLVTQASCLVLFNPRLTDLLLSTIPHFAGGLGVAASVLRRLPFHYWLMDMNPDQIVALGKLQPDSMAVRAFDLLNRRILEKAASIVTLDEAMARRFAAKSPRHPCIEVQPPWPAQHATKPFARDQNPFRAKHGLGQVRLVMHAGNHSAVHPLDTLLEAMRRHENSNLHYLFVGGGVGKGIIEQWVRDNQPRNVKLLPYQPRAEVPAMLAAADVHVVSVGPQTVGIVHPSKIYGALAAGCPILVLGPGGSPAAQLARNEGVGWHVEHGDVEAATHALEEIQSMSADSLEALKLKCLQLSQQGYSREQGVATFCARLLKGDVM